MIKNKNLQYFVGKVCTIFTHQINRNFKEENPATFAQQPYHYFVGIIEVVEDDGILVTQIKSGLKTFFFKQALIAIAEEEVLDPTNEEDSKIINDFIQSNVQARQKVKDGFVNVDEMDSLLQNIKTGA